MHKKVFERFQTLKPRDQVEGSGMGLAMVQKTAQHLGGNIELESDLGTGSTFTFYWPI
jgi:signal transduction histidine kinase